MFLASNFRNRSALLTMQYPCNLRRRTMFLLRPFAIKSSARRRFALASGAAFVLLICASVSFAQDVPAAPAPQSQITPASPAQPQAVHLQDYSKPSSSFPRFLQPYKSKEVAQPNMGNSPRIDALMRNGKIYLSIDDGGALTLENNLDIDIARYNLNIADTDYL